MKIPEIQVQKTNIKIIPNLVVIDNLSIHLDKESMAVNKISKIKVLLHPTYTPRFNSNKILTIKIGNSINITKRKSTS